MTTGTEIDLSDLSPEHQQSVRDYIEALRSDNAGLRRAMQAMAAGLIQGSVDSNEAYADVLEQLAVRNREETGPDT